MQKPMIPKEHGAWAVLFVPMVVGAAASGSFSGKIILLALSSLGVFLSYAPLQEILRGLLGRLHTEDNVGSTWFWGLAYLSAGLAFAVPLLLEGYWLLVPIGLGALVAFGVSFFLTLRRPRTIGGDLVAVAGLTLSAPSAYYISSNKLDETALSLWVLNTLFFGSSVFYVHMKIQARSVKKARLTWIERLSLGRSNLIYHFIVVAIVVVMTALHLTPELALLAFVPVTIHALIGTLKLSGEVRFKKLGFLLLAQSVVYGVLLTAFLL